MTKKELIDMLATCDEDDEIYISGFNFWSTPRPLKLLSKTETAMEIFRQSAIVKIQDNMLGTNLHLAMAKATKEQAENKLAKKETITWRKRLDKAENEISKYTHDLDLWCTQLDFFETASWDKL